MKFVLGISLTALNYLSRYPVLYLIYSQRELKLNIHVFNLKKNTGKADRIIEYRYHYRSL